VVPISINNLGKWLNMVFPLVWEIVTFVIHNPLKVSEFDFEELKRRKETVVKGIKILIYIKCQ
jgi:1-acyl-sn-glycerol-3-phosphate acyltransferase